MDARRAMEETMALAEKGKDKMPEAGPLSWMHLNEMLKLMHEGGHSYGKMCRWLGWMQCAVVAAGLATLTEIGHINERAAE